MRGDQSFSLTEQLLRLKCSERYLNCEGNHQTLDISSLNSNETKEVSLHHICRWESQLLFYFCIQQDDLEVRKQQMQGRKPNPGVLCKCIFAVSSCLLTLDLLLPASQATVCESQWPVTHQ